MAALLIIGAFSLMALLAPLIAPHDPYKQNLNERLEPPSLKYPFGTDHLGRCLLSRMIYGTRPTFITSILIVFIQLITGVVIGTLSGYYGAVIDKLTVWLIDTTMAFPALVLSLVLGGIIGPGRSAVIISLSAVGWVEFARMTRGTVLSLKEREFVEGAKALGFSNRHIIARYILPNSLAPLIPLAALSTGVVILIVSAVGFLGLGAQPPATDWGMILNEGKAYMRTAPHLTLFPGLFIMLTTLSFNLLGDALRDIMDPRYKAELLREL